MNFMKNVVLVLCLFFLIGCLKIGSNQNGLQAFDLSKTKMDSSTYPIVIIGGGIGGLTASTYCAQANLNTILLTGDNPGGAITMSHSIRNWPGEIDITGKNLVGKLEKQAKENGVTFSNKIATSVNFSSWPYEITTKDLTTGKQEIIKALTSIIAMGTTPGYLNIPGGEKFWGNGVTTCAICDGPLYKNKIVAIVGGGKAAITETNYLSNIAKKVFIIVRKDTLKASNKMVDEVVKKTNVEIIYNTQVKKIAGNNKVTHLVVFNSKENKEKQINVDGLFLAIGAVPNNKILKNQLNLDSNGYIIVNKDQETNKPGIYAIGDISDSKYKQAISAAGDGCKAALQAQTFLEKIGYKPIKNKVEQKEIVVETIQKPAEIKEITTTNEFEEHVVKSTLPVVVDFYATWCMPCKMMTPIFKTLAEEFNGKVNFVKINVNNASALALRMSIQGVPTFIFFNNGNLVKRFSGAKSLQDFKTIINSTF